MKNKTNSNKRGGEDLERVYLYDAHIESDAGITDVHKSRFSSVKDMGDVLLRHLGRYGLALPFIRPGYRILDIPCGSGLALEVFGPLQQFGQFSYEGRDLDAPTIDYCRSVYGSRYPWADFSLGDLTKLELEKESYDTILCVEGIEHIGRKSQSVAVRQFAKGLKHGGTLVMSSPLPVGGLSGQSVTNPYHLSELSRRDFLSLLSESFNPDNIGIITQENILSTGEKTTMHYAFCHK